MNLHSDTVVSFSGAAVVTNIVKALMHYTLLLLFRLSPGGYYDWD